MLDILTPRQELCGAPDMERQVSYFLSGTQRMTKFYYEIKCDNYF